MDEFAEERKLVQKDFIKRWCRTNDFIYIEPNDIEQVYCLLRDNIIFDTDTEDIIYLARYFTLNNCFDKAEVCYKLKKSHYACDGSRIRRLSEQVNNALCTKPKDVMGHLFEIIIYIENDSPYLDLFINLILKCSKFPIDMNNVAILFQKLCHFIRFNLHPFPLVDIVNIFIENLKISNPDIFPDSIEKSLEKIFEVIFEESNKLECDPFHVNADYLLHSVCIYMYHSQKRYLFRINRMMTIAEKSILRCWKFNDNHPVRIQKCAEIYYQQISPAHLRAGADGIWKNEGLLDGRGRYYYDYEDCKKHLVVVMSMFRDAYKFSIGSRSERYFYSLFFNCLYRCEKNNMDAFGDSLYSNDLMDIIFEIIRLSNQDLKEETITFWSENRDFLNRYLEFRFNIVIAQKHYTKLTIQNKIKFYSTQQTQLGECCVCMEEVELVEIEPCIHDICIDCVREILHMGNAKCPICREDM